MGYEEEVHIFLTSRRGEFLRFSEIRRSLGHLNDSQLSKALKRLEDDGLVATDIRHDHHRPVNVYVGIDPSDSNIKVTVYDDEGWMFCWFEWKYGDGHSMSVSMNLGEMAQYIHPRGEQMVLEWLPWMEVLIEVGRLEFKETTKLGRS